MDVEHRGIRGVVQEAARGNATRESVAQVVARNDGTFSEASERIRASAEEFARDVKVAFSCECGLEDCGAIVRLRLDDYETLRSGGRRFFTAPGHEPAASRDARVVARRGTYVIIEETGAGRVRRRAPSLRRFRPVRLQRRR